MGVKIQEFQASLPEIQRDYLFDVNISGIDAGTMKILKPRIRTIVHPNITVDVGNTRYGQKVIKNPNGISLPDAISISFLEGEDNLVLNTYYDLVKKIYNPDGSRNAPSTYEQLISVIYYNVKHEPVSRAVFEGCWVSDLDSTTLDQEGSAGVIRTITWQTEDLSIQS